MRRRQVKDRNAIALSASAPNEIFVNVGALNAQIRALESRINALEAAAAAQRK